MQVLCDCQMLVNCSQVASDRDVAWTSRTRRDAWTTHTQIRAAALLPMVLLDMHFVSLWWGLLRVGDQLCCGGKTAGCSGCGSTDAAPGAWKQQLADMTGHATTHCLNKLQDYSS
jgi:hypothetical protein